MKDYNEKAIKDAKEIGCDLLQFTTHNITCGECSKYQGRVFSISGNDKRFPKLPDQIIKKFTIHDGCNHILTVYVDKFQSTIELKEAIKKSNMPFIDSRSGEEKQQYEKQQLDAYIAQQDRKNYEKMIELFPDIAPKSFSSFKRMKNTHTSNYLILVDKMKTQGLNIE